MQLDRRTARASMQPVDILRDQFEGFEASLRRSQGNVPGIRLRRSDQTAPPRVPAPYQRWIRTKAILGRKLHRIEFRPQSVCCIAKRWNAAFGGDTRAGKDRDAARLRDVIACGAQA